MSTAALDVDAIRARFSALQTPWALFDAPGGTQVPDSVIEAWRQKHALKRIGQPIEVARLAAFLISTDSSFITGSYHLVDGGLLASF